MLESLFRLMDLDFLLPFLFVVALVLLWHGLIRWRRKEIRAFLRVPKESVIYRDRWAAGRSMKDWQSHLFGISGFLGITVTVEELIVSRAFPTDPWVKTDELDHRVQKTRISSFKASKRGFEVRFSDDQGTHHVIQLFPKKPDAFRQAMQQE